MKTKFDGFVKRRKIHIPSFRRKPESSHFNMFWMPDQVRHDDSETFYESIKFQISTFRERVRLWKAMGPCHFDERVLAGHAAVGHFLLWLPILARHANTRQPKAEFILTETHKLTTI